MHLVDLDLPVIFVIESFGRFFLKFEKEHQSGEVS